MAKRKQTQYNLDELNENGEYIKIGGSPIPGITLEKVLRGYYGVINRFEWSHNGRLIASPNQNGSVIVWDVESESKLREIWGHDEKVYSVTWSPDDNIVASASWDRSIRLTNMNSGQEHKIETNSAINALTWIPDSNLLVVGTEFNGVQFWDTESGKLTSSIRDHNGNINNISLSPDGNFLATASADRTIIIWDINMQKQIAKFSGFGDWVFDVAWSPDGKLLCSCSWDRTIRIWDIEKRNLIGICEGHEANIQSVSYSCDGKIFASKSLDSTIRLWDSLSFVEIAEIMEYSSLRYSPRLRFHPSQLKLATLGESDEVIRIWGINTDLLISSNIRDNAIKYSSAKLVLVGDSGVGKTGLGWRLAHNEFKEHSSTHGQQFWVIPELGIKQKDGTECEAILWDLAGQHVYRPIHSIFLDNVDASLVLFDASDRQDPLKGVEFWLNQLAGKNKLPPSILVGARSDVSPTSLPKTDLDQFCQRYGITGGYISTSAKTGEGLDKLLEILKKQIPWEQMSATVTTATFKSIKDFVLALKEKLVLKEKDERKNMLVIPAELRHQLQAIDENWEFSDTEMMTAVRHLQTHGYLFILKSSSGDESILLAPNVLVNLASSIVSLADKNPRDLGAVSETDLLRSKYTFEELEGLDKDQQHILIDSAILRFLDHTICFRETLGNETLLIFPDLIKQKRPLQDKFDSVDDVSYILRGRVENIYAALVVLLGYTSTFTRINQWQNQAQYEMGDDEICGFRLIEEREGELELVLYYSPIMPAYGRSMFQGLFEKFLNQRDVTVTRVPPVTCPTGHLQQRATVMNMLHDGAKSMFCAKCGKEIILPELNKPVAIGARILAQVDEEDARARLRNTYETSLTRVKSFRSDRNSPHCYISYADEQLSWSGELIRDLQAAGVIVLEDREQVKKDDFIVVVGTQDYLDALEKSVERIVMDATLIHSRVSNSAGQKPMIAPLLVEGNAFTAFPREIRGYMPGDFRIDSQYVVSLFDLILTLYAIPFDQLAFEPLRKNLLSQWEETLNKKKELPQQGVYISYAWGGESELTVNDLDKAFQEQGVTLIRDKRDLGYKGRIKAFMETIGKGKAVILVISEKYLKSENCMFELLQISKNSEFTDRIFPIVLDDAKIYAPVDRIRYVTHWEQKIAELDEAIRSVGAANLHGFRDDMDLYTEIRANLPRLAEILKDMNTLSAKIHRETGYQQLFDDVVSKLEE